MTCAVVIDHNRWGRWSELLIDKDRLRLWLRRRLLLTARHRDAVLSPLDTIEVARAWRTAVAKSGVVVRIWVPAGRDGGRWRDCRRRRWRRYREVGPRRRVASDLRQLFTVSVQFMFPQFSLEQVRSNVLGGPDTPLTLDLHRPTSANRPQ